jgi:ABC-type sugar transport system ATPase subunit
MSTLHTDKLTLAYDQAVIIREMNVTVPSGQITALVGPNGCGKSTLLRGIARLLAPKGGAAYLDGKAIHQMPTRELAKQLGMLPQGPVAPEGLTVRELVAQGRYLVHDLNHATRHAHHLITLKAGTVVASGAPSAVVTPRLLREVFGVEAEVVPDPRIGVPLCVAYGLAEYRPDDPPLPLVEQIDAATLHAILAVTAGPLVVDVRSSEEYAAGHVPDARHIPLDELEQRLGELPRNRQIVTYCTMRHPGASRGERAAALLGCRLGSGPRAGAARSRRRCAG